MWSGHAHPLFHDVPAIAGAKATAPSVVWAKLRSLKEGAAIGTKRLWG